LQTHGLIALCSAGKASVGYGCSSSLGPVEQHISLGGREGGDLGVMLEAQNFPPARG
jgi:hypothetical protein